MRVVFLGNGEVAVRAVELLRELGDEIALLVVHPHENAAMRDELIATADVADDFVFEAYQMQDPAFLDVVAGADADVTLSVKFGYRIKGPFLELFPEHAFNLHMSLLPYNRGAYPTAWCIVDRTPAGVTLHLMDEEFDTGPIIAQQEAPVMAWDTGESMYRKCNDVAIDLLRATWPAVQGGTTQPMPQPHGGTSHRFPDAAEIDEIRLDDLVEAGRLLDILRARTFPPYQGAFFRAPDGRRVFLRLELIPEEIGQGGGTT